METDENSEKMLTESRNGEMLMICEECWDFHEGLAKINKGKNCVPGDRGEIDGGKYGFIDMNGKVVVPIVYDWVSEMYSSGAFDLST